MHALRAPAGWIEAAMVRWGSSQKIGYYDWNGLTWSEFDSNGDGVRDTTGRYDRFVEPK